MTVPTLVFEVAFDSDPLDDTPTWTDITTYVRHSAGVHVRRGRASELDSFSPGSASLTLNNRTRRFDPRYSAGPYFGKLLTGKQARIRATWNGSTVDVFTGFVSGWPCEYAKGGVDAWVPLELADALSRLAAAEQPDVVEALVLTDIGSCQLFLRSALGARWLDSSGNGRHATPTNIGTFGAGSFGAPLNPVTGTTGITGGKWVFPTVTMSDYSASFWFSSSALPRGTSVNDGVATTLLIGDSAVASGEPQVNLIDVPTAANPGLLTATTSPNEPTIARSNGEQLNDAAAHHVVITHDSASKTLSLYVDGVLNATDTYAGASVTVSAQAVELCNNTVGSTSTYEASATMSDLMVFSQVLNAAEVLSLYQIDGGYLEESTSARVTRLLDNIDWPTAWRSITTAAAGRCGDYNPTGQPTLSELEAVATTEQGRLFIAKDGDVTFHDRYHYLTQARGTTVQATFSDDGADIAYEAIGTDFDERDVRNDINVSGSRGAFGDDEDTASITAYGRQSQSIATLLPTNAECEGMADGLVYHRKDATTRTRGPIVARADNRKNSTAEVTALLGLEIGDRIRHEQTPMRIGSQAVLQLLIEGISWDINMNEWVMSIDASPVPGAAVAATSFLVVSDATFGVVGTGLVGY